MNLQKLIYPYQDIFFHKLLESSVVGCHTVLDVGCGSSSPLGNIKKTFRSEGIDLFGKSIASSKQLKIHDAYRIGDIRNINKWYKRKSYDAVIALDVVEHLGKKEALQLIKKMEIIARKRVVIMTPNGFHRQHTYDNNPYQVHKSGWSVKDFNSLGYLVRGLRGWKSLRGECATIIKKPWIFWGIIAFISEPFLSYIPSFSYDIFAVKTISS